MGFNINRKSKIKAVWIKKYKLILIKFKNKRRGHYVKL